MTQTKTKERPILFNGEMVRAILDGRKTQTRRVVKPQIGTDPCDKFVHVEVTVTDGWYYWWDYICGPGSYDVDQAYHHIKCPYGEPGDHLYVRETWCPQAFNGVDGYVGYRADRKVFVKSTYGGMHEAARHLLDTQDSPIKWKPSIHMPRWASRITLEITDVRVERVQDISGQDAFWEGCNVYNPADDRIDHIGHHPSYSIGEFKSLWNSTNEKRGYGWDVNPWVWVIEFKRLAA